MKISWIKYEKDYKSFVVPERIGMDIYKLKNMDDIDKKLEELIDNNYKTIILSNEIAGFSENIIKKYKNSKDINIIISLRK